MGRFCAHFSAHFYQEMTINVPECLPQELQVKRGVDEGRKEELAIIFFTKLTGLSQYFRTSKMHLVTQGWCEPYIGVTLQHHFLVEKGRYCDSSVGRVSLSTSVSSSLWSSLPGSPALAPWLFQGHWWSLITLLVTMAFEKVPWRLCKEGMQWRPWLVQGPHTNFSTTFSSLTMHGTLLWHLSFASRCIQI